MARGAGGWRWPLAPELALLVLVLVVVLALLVLVLLVVLAPVESHGQRRHVAAYYFKIVAAMALRQSCSCSCTCTNLRSPTPFFSVVNSRSRFTCPPEQAAVAVLQPGTDPGS